MQQPKTPIVFLEDWLRSSSSSTSSTSASTSNLKSTPAARSTASAILQAWSELRDPSVLSQPHRLLSSLQTLTSVSPSSLHVADPQAKLLISLLSSSSSPLPPPSLPLISRLLYTWLRKSPRPSPHLLQSLSSPSLLSLLSPSPPSLLLVSALSSAPALPDSSRSLCLDLLLQLLHQQSPSDDSLPETLAAIGYSLSRSDDAHFTAILSSLFRIWGSDQGLMPSIHHALIILRLFEWLVSGFIALRSFSRIEALCSEISETKKYPRFAVAMVAAGSLRAFRLSSSSGRAQLSARFMNSLEGTIASVAEFSISGGEGAEKQLLMQCVSLGLVRCGTVSFNPSMLLCLCSALLDEVFPLRLLFSVAVETLKVGDFAATLFNKLKEHLGSVLFKEGGAITGVLCNQYTMADEDHKVIVENYIWRYAGDLYYGLRKTFLLLRGKNDELIGQLDKIAEAAFLMVVVFAAEVTKHKLNPKLSDQFKAEVAVRILVAFSCIEYLRRIRLPEYTEAVRRAVSTIQENKPACSLFVELMPPYAELTNQSGALSLEGMRYHRWKDDVQTARILFCMRVIPTCISLVHGSAFGKHVAPTMFLYMVHPNEKVARASHSVFVAFLSSGKDTEQDDRSALKEKLVYYYVQRSLEAYPGVTPFDGLASGIAALVRHLPAGSPAIFYCIQSLVEKATDLCSKALSQDATMWKSWKENSEPCKKVLDLLLRLIALVDIQVLSYLLKQLAEFVVQLPEEGRNVLLDEMYAQVAESDDVTRKPVLVSWLQSLAYLCSQNKSASYAKKGSNSRADKVASLSATARL